MVPIPGIIDSKSNFVEHPEVVAQRIEAVVWAKLRALHGGVEIASGRLWGKRAA